MKINGLLRLQKGVNGFRGDRPTERQWQPTNTAHDPNPPITLESGGGGAVTHATTGTLTGAGATLSGTARHNTPHATTGTLTGPGSAVVGSANRFRAHASTGALVGSGSTIAGSANHSPAAVPHTTTGALAGPGSVVVGVSSRFRAHPTTGTLTGAGSVIVGSANRSPVAVPHTTTGTLTGQGSAVAGTSSRFRAHATTGSLAGAGSVIIGAARHNTPHPTTGTLIGQGSTVDGTADRSATYPAPADVLAGLVYGPSGIFTGTLASSPNAPSVGLRSFTTNFLAGPGAIFADAPFSAYPDPAYVLVGVVYGPGGVYIGSLTPSTGETIIGLRSFTGRS